MKLLLLLFASIFILSCDNENTTSNVNPCKDNPCKTANQTTCEVNGEDYNCLCDSGYELKGDTCVETCENKECQENSECKIVDAKAECICDEGFILNNDTCELKPEEKSFHKVWSDNEYTENSGISLTINKNKEIIVVGYQSSKMAWNEAEQKELPTASDTTLRKFSSEGELIWAKAWNDSEYDLPVGVVTDSKGNIFIAGERGGDFLRAFIMKVDKDGNKIWTKDWSCDNGLFVWDLEIDNDDNMYITGRTYSSFNNTTSVGGISDSYLIKVSDQGTSGKEEWIKQWGTTAMDEGKAILIKDEKILVLTENNGNTDLEEGAIKWDFNITTFNKSGAIESDINWMKGLVDTYVVDFAVDSNGNYYVIGDSPRNFDGHVNKGDNDIFLVKLNSSLTKTWSKLIGTEHYDTTNTIAIDSEDNVVIAGYTFGSFANHTNPDEGVESDSLIIKFNKDATANTEPEWYKMFSSEDNLTGDSISKLIIKDDNLLFTGVESANYINGTQNLKSSGYLKKLIKSDL